MRINVYSQELITADDERPVWYPHDRPLSEAEPLPIIELLTEPAGTGIVYSAVRLFLHSPKRLHHRPGDDDRSAVTFWLPKSKKRRDHLASTFRHLADLISSAPPETGLD